MGLLRVHKGNHMNIAWILIVMMAFVGMLFFFFEKIPAPYEPEFSTRKVCLYLYEIGLAALLLWIVFK